jgi:hypothetical protein
VIEDGSTLLVIDESLEVVQELDLRALGTCGAISGQIGDRFYFDAAIYDADTGTYADTLNYYSLSDEQIHTVLSGYSCQTLDVLAHGEHLFVIQFDVNYSDKNRVLVLDAQTHETVGSLQLPFQPLNALMKGDSLYLAGFYKETGREGLIEYRIEGIQLTQLHESSLNQEVTELGHRQKSGYFVSGLFSRD